MTEKEWMTLYKISFLLESLRIGPTITRIDYFGQTLNYEHATPLSQIDKIDGMSKDDVKNHLMTLFFNFQCTGFHHRNLNMNTVGVVKIWGDNRFVILEHESITKEKTEEFNEKTFWDGWLKN